MKEILGLAVLTSPLFLVVPWLFVAMWVAAKASQLPKMSVAKLAVGAVTFVVIFLLPFSDDIVGRVYFKHLCNTEAGVKVYQTVELPADYWDAQGRPKFFKANGDLDQLFLNNRFGELTTAESYSTLFGIDERDQKLIDNSNQEILGEVISFMYWGGWVSRELTPTNTAIDCKAFHGNKFWHDFYMRFFKPAKI